MKAIQFTETIRMLLGPYEAGMPPPVEDPERTRHDADSKRFLEELHARELTPLKLESAGEGWRHFGINE